MEKGSSLDFACSDRISDSEHALRGGWSPSYLVWRPAANGSRCPAFPVEAGSICLERRGGGWNDGSVPDPTAYAFAVSPSNSSAGMRKRTTRARIILRLRPRLPESTSDTRLRLPNNGTKSFGASPCCSIRNRIAATGSGLAIGNFFSS